MLKKLFKHKFITFLILILIIAGGYFGYNKFYGKQVSVRYVTATVEKGTLIVSVSGSGQVLVSDQVEIKPKVSGEIVYVGVKNGQEVKAGSLIAQLDARDAQKAVRDAEVNLESARLAMDKLKLQQQQQLRGDTLNKTYEDGMKILADFYGDFSTILGSIDDILFSNDLSDNYDNISYYANYFLSYSQKNSPVPNSAKNLFSEVEKLHQRALTDFQNAERGSGDARSKAINSGYELAVKTAQLIKLGRDAVRPLYDYFASSDSSTHTKWDVIEGHANDLAAYASTIDTHLQSLLTAENTINSQRDAVENQLLDLRSQEITIRQRENALLDAKEKLADYYVRAPFDGVIAKVDAKKGDIASSASIIATLITQQKLAEVFLNEVDVVQVKVGQKATLTFDALPDLSISGKVIEVDTVGTVSQGVVSYGVKLILDTQDERIKSGMSITADIITDSKQDILVLPNSSIKSQGNSYYVELVEVSEEMKQQLLTNVSGAILPQPLKMQPVEIGLSNDLFTEIVSGLEEGDIVVITTISPTTNQTNRVQTTQGFQIPRMGGQMRISR